jgi:excisionase family DNA binding protein
MPNKKIMTAEQVAGYLGLHRETVYLYAKTGKLPAFKIGYSWRFKRDSIDSWVEEQEKNNCKQNREIFK